MMTKIPGLVVCLLFCYAMQAQKKQHVEVVRETDGKINILINKKPFTSFLCRDTMEKPILYPVHAANGTIVTRGFPLNPLGFSKPFPSISALNPIDLT